METNFNGKLITNEADLLEFAEKVNLELAEEMDFEYATYDNYGHVPYPSFYDGLKYVLKIE